MQELIVLAAVMSSLVFATHSQMDKCVMCIEFSFNYSYSLWQLVSKSELIYFNRIMLC